MEDRFQRSDIRMRTIENLARKHNVDLIHADKIKAQSTLFFKQLSSHLNIKKNDELVSLLGWGALLHEVGLSICYQGFHRHSAYILQYTNMPGFNQEQQMVLSTLARFHRKSPKTIDLVEFNLFNKDNIIQLIRILRLAVLLNGQRSDDDLPEFNLAIDDENQDHWCLSCKEADWLDNNKLLHADLVAEQGFWSKVGWKLSF
ncbi:hypothetical protein ACLKMH_16545 [Psychromonas sp. KJ10-10]|uniref:hypothetical protein n=1 Tax=Psychromonas sp. KJ10-10 TaxID=3391823 RepID=UPI0039B62A54